MSVIVVTKFDASASALEEMVTGRHKETVLQLREAAVAAGAIRHVFAEDRDGKLMVSGFPRASRAASRWVRRRSRPWGRTSRA